LRWIEFGFVLATAFGAILTTFVVPPEAFSLLALTAFREPFLPFLRPLERSNFMIARTNSSFRILCQPTTPRCFAIWARSLQVYPLRDADESTDKPPMGQSTQVLDS
jgi:hypothetical protein